MTTYQVKINNKVVWKGKSAEYDKSTIPAKYRERPKKGKVELYVDGTLISTLTPISAAEHASIVAQRDADLGRPEG